MYKLLANRIKAAEQLKDPAHVRIAVLGIFRITMQHACVTLGEWIVRALRENPARLSSYTSVDIAMFAQPADGALVSLLSQLLVAAENIGWRSVGRHYWEQTELPAELRQLTGTTRANLETILTAFVRSRNDGAEGHGLPGGYSPQTDVAVVQTLIRCLAGILPTVSKDDGRLYLPTQGDRPAEELTTLKLFDSNPICYRRLRRTSAGRVQIDAQIQKTLLTRDETTYEVPNVLLDLPRSASPEYDIAEPVWTDSWKPFIHIPGRLASSDVFTGRAKEISALADWADDTDSRKCMVWGDGGVGKTTLVVEFLHRLLEGSTTVEWRPELITFYTAKKTRWGLQGLEQISAQDIGVADVALDIARMLTTPNLDRSWFEKTPRDVIQKLASLLAEMKISRDNHLIVLDNTETMARSDADVQALAMQINELSRRVGRVVLTSRRREHIEALPVQTENWSEEEGAEFLRKRGNALRCISIQQAGDATLKKYSRSLINKPIALEVFVQAASAPGISLDSAFQRVQRMQRQDLGQFLYDDAWARLSPELRRVLLLMSRLGDSHDQYLLQLCCQRADVSVAAASEAIEESKGIASITRFEGTLQITLSAEFYNYCIERWEQIDGKRTPTDEDVEWVRRRYAEFLQSASAQVHDRNVRAFRVPAARAAWKSFTEDRLDDSLGYYEVAILEDAENGWLFDRYAYTLMKVKKYELALEKSKRAVLLLPDDPEVYFTKGMIEGRIGNASNAVADLDKAAKHGKPKHLCELQKAYAYVYSSPANLTEARACLDKANRSAPKDKFLSRFIDEATRFERRWLSPGAKD
ncbi:tetratricopeptide repeat protein [Bordetella hinzii]|uniref:tetratricopeptide repeat protein n=1 Tax=Bordetella hinzii TaxID=103855 RepID=UPI001153A21D|nr:tetratricopeptide repeat protein [Bordetella hinzii]